MFGAHLSSTAIEYFRHHAELRCGALETFMQIWGKLHGFFIPTILCLPMSERK